MKRYISLVLCCLFSLYMLPQKTAKNPSSIYIDHKGVMRWSDSHREASFFGVNYTLPFAHAYRAMGYLGINRKEAIDRDVYHFARLGFNAYRIHIWDVEVSDHKGNLIENDHLDLLDYLISKLKERGISVLLTAQTNFGNGYPEKNQPTGGFSYEYDKCEIHTNEKAIEIQEHYIYNLINHVNPYTGKAYKEDPTIVGFEINNEPCHDGTLAQTKHYIERMLKAIKKTGNKKPIFYNVSQSSQQAEAYYSTNIQGTTYQWYPIGLVAGHTRKGNFLPAVDRYDIPFSNVKGFSNKPKLVYEFDPADITYSYMYPAVVRTFRKAGFQWITQFAYDPIDMAWANTEYQTHFLNLAYTPSKAISMKIAAEVAYHVPRNKSFGTYPADTLFDVFRVSYHEDLSLLNSPKKFFYSNNTTAQPVAPDQLQSLAGHGNSPIVHYEGTGAYFADKLEDGVWRLEVMPDAVQVKDPFEKPSLKKEVVSILWNTWNMKINLPALGTDFSVTGLNDGNSFNQEASNDIITALHPGVYLLQRKGITRSSHWNKNTRWQNIRLGEFVAPKSRVSSYQVVHTPATSIEEGMPLRLEATIIGPQPPDSVLIYTDKISFWNSHNPYYLMKNVGGYRYEAVIPAQVVTEGRFRYTLTIYHKDSSYTFPAGVKGAPLDWDYYQNEYWESNVVTADSSIRLITSNEHHGIETYVMPEWAPISSKVIFNAPTKENTLKFDVKAQNIGEQLFIRKWIGDELVARKKRLSTCKYLCLNIAKSEADTLTVGFITNMGYTYKATVHQSSGIVRIPLSNLVEGKTALLPHQYPTFLKKYYEPTINIPFKIENIETLELTLIPADGKTSTLELGSVWIE